MGYYWAVRKVAIAMGMTLVIKGQLSLFRLENSVGGFLNKCLNLAFLLVFTQSQLASESKTQISNLVESRSNFLGTDDGLFISMQTILKNSDNNLYFDRVRETFGLTRNEKISFSPITIEGNIMKYDLTIDHSGKHICDIHVTYEKVSDMELKSTNTIDDVTAIRVFKKTAE